MPFTALIAMISFLVILGCAGGVAPPATTSSTFADAEAENMFKAGFTAIADRFVETLSAEAIALNGLRGFSDLDPTVALTKRRNTVDFSLNGRVLASEPTPKARDVDGWAKVIVWAWREGRAASPRIATASQEDVYEAVFDRVTAMLDANSRYASAAEAQRNRQRRDGYHGIGVRVGIKAGEPVIVEVSGRGPGERAGLRVGDFITQIDGAPVTGTSAEAVMARLQEDAAGRVRLAIRRPGRGVQQYVVPRSYLIPETVRQRYADGILYLSIDRFNQGTADAIAGTLAEFAGNREPRLRGVVLDLRGNPGGLLQQAVKISDLFLSRGPILSTRGRHPDSAQDYLAGGDDLIHGLPLVILIDGETASAAELAAAALNDRARAVVVGSTSYGKGTVQTVVPMPNGGELSFTWSHAVLPSGTDMRSGGGVRPAICTSGIYVADRDSIVRLFARGTPSRAEADGLGCPGERRDGPVDLEVARRLVQERELYGQALRSRALLAEAPRGTEPIEPILPIEP